MCKFIASSMAKELLLRKNDVETGFWVFFILALLLINPRTKAKVEHRVLNYSHLHLLCVNLSKILGRIKHYSISQERSIVATTISLDPYY